ncbi:hypothetical protein HU200_010296 [Digitaria exilis]|uniref:Uncharacterized protein n=1 Tax=Digitaria exilis TaxID=1010633 RepID=A0A835KPZ0_9POAL|nr:hypothetical protein HU200_010296 [Digitaria exilis]CAB3457878.1 unnamed protein product [Digitaria exilis]
MGNKTTAATSWRWRLLLLLLVTVAALCWIPPAIAAAAAAAAASTANGARRSLLGFVEAQGNASYHCSPSGPCVPCQYSEKNDEKYSCSETGYRLPLKCVQAQNVTTKEGNKSKQRKILDDGSSSSGTKSTSGGTKATTGGPKQYITYRSCVPLEGEEKLSFLGFEVIMAGMLLVSGPFIYYRKRRTNLMQGAARIPTSPPRF